MLTRIFAGVVLRGAQGPGAAGGHGSGAVPGAGAHVPSVPAPQGPALLAAPAQGAQHRLRAGARQAPFTGCELERRAMSLYPILPVTSSSCLSSSAAGIGAARVHRADEKCSGF